MTVFLRRLLTALLCLCLAVGFLPRQVSAAESGEAEDISGPEILTDSSGFLYTAYLFDKYHGGSGGSNGPASLTLEYSEGIGSLYIIFGKEYGAYTVTDNTTGEVRTWGENLFLHEFLDLEAAFGTAPTSITVDFAAGSVELFEIYVFTSGQVPDFVQRWDMAPEDKVDLILFSTHGDDEQLFFAGILPYYAKELDYEVLVVYLTDHRSHSPHRVHEILNGLWAVGVTNYPVLGSFPDFLRNTSWDTYYAFSTMGIKPEDIWAYILEQLRRFKPQVVVGHDFNGEYSHGQHMVYAEQLAEALEVSNDPEQFPELAEKYGVWDVPKAYFHLYWENEIVMDWDRPLESFEGMTAFEVTKYLGFPCHESQVKDFNYWIGPYDTAASIPTFNPCLYGLYRTAVGPDVQKNDFFENLTSYAEQERLAEEVRLAEEARLREEEEARRKAEEEAARKAAEEEAARKAAEEEEQRRAEEAARLETEEEALRRAKEDRKRMILGAAMAAAAAAALFILAKHAKKQF